MFEVTPDSFHEWRPKMSDVTEGESAKSETGTTNEVDSDGSWTIQVSNG
jgi:hypothetical protein